MVLAQGGWEQLRDDMNNDTSDMVTCPLCEGQGVMGHTITGVGGEFYHPSCWTCNGRRSVTKAVFESYQVFEKAEQERLRKHIVMDTSMKITHEVARELLELPDVPLAIEMRCILRGYEITACMTEYDPEGTAILVQRKIVSKSVTTLPP